jgi:hypothetical protein
MSDKKIFTVFVPFIPMGLSKEELLFKKFEQFDIGKIVHIHLREKKSAKLSHTYAFLEIEPYSSTAGKSLRENLLANKKTSLFYELDGNIHRLDLKPYLSIDERITLGYKCLKVDNGLPEWLNTVSMEHKCSTTSTYSSPYFRKLHEQIDIMCDYNSIEQDMLRVTQETM